MKVKHGAGDNSAWEQWLGQSAEEEGKGLVTISAHADREASDGVVPGSANGVAGKS